ncbi:hypothetical protein SAMN02745121_07580 [Nannocystis exedens]|uniref:Glycosyl-4,4'-diaponeurosporenoate acyltransferase n=1 Tax=Nannocystis exedens TaxID=54 RepID=A0A1I2GYV3_9BACT|nr:hypothetical protein [Nannocystis exedens]PCC68890.1 hypothetical protein NAEX_01911 [Nannocystis exedens]SFF22239.1 hypothetical protein SAMN02745121_07580 [Nannocystis exedens]
MELSIHGKRPFPAQYLGFWPTREFWNIAIRTPLGMGAMALAFIALMLLDSLFSLSAWQIWVYSLSQLPVAGLIERFTRDRIRRRPPRLPAQSAPAQSTALVQAGPDQPLGFCATEEFQRAFFRHHFGNLGRAVRLSLELSLGALVVFATGPLWGIGMVMVYVVWLGAVERRLCRRPELPE